ncbi:hypothetical protein [Microbacter margulisiae]|uniref:Uncharacterized protein n=1 Tax=Microbacter margulisiae TaxID=1350067 RepID=A0A7W5H2L3_9PORP|nr:hypothetical protein [Microbacter margulisiae]MBB3187517.1 hypothetical protein [Microbacter margulisiae]
MITYAAVLHLRNKNPQAVAELGGRVAAHLEAHKDIFPAPDPAPALLEAEAEKLSASIAAKNGSRLINLNVKNQAVVVRALLKAEIFYVNKVAQGDRKTILLSGFDCNNDPVLRSIPGKAVIRRVKDGNTACSVKIFVEPLADADHYKVEITTTPDDPDSWRAVFDYVSLKKLELRDLPRAKEICIRVSGGNIYGWGTPSEMVSFLPR